jgi:hypothetical protein
MPKGVYVRTKRVMRATLADRFWAKVQKTDGCWLWTGALMSKGYGSINMGKRGVTALAPRVSWLLHYGVMPTAWVLHHCDNPPCVRIDHLFLGDVQANADDMNAKGRGVLPKRQPTHAERARGERNGFAKLTPEQVAEIRRRYAAGGVSQQSLADEFGFGQSTISHIVLRETWAHVL